MCRDGGVPGLPFQDDCQAAHTCLGYTEINEICTLVYMKWYPFFWILKNTKTGQILFISCSLNDH